MLRGSQIQRPLFADCPGYTVSPYIAQTRLTLPFIRRKKFCREAGANAKPCVFLFSDSQIKEESYVEDINNLLNSGEVPNLFPYDDRAAVMETCRVAAKKAGVTAPEGGPLEDPTQLWQYFIKTCRANLHVVLCFSPIGEAFRERLRQFPSLVNCCTIDW